MAADQVEKKTTSKSDVFALYEAGMKALHSRDYSKADQAFGEIIRAFPDEMRVVERARTFQRVAQRRQQEPISTDSRDTEFLFNSGVFYHNRGEYKQALEFFRKGLELAGKENDHILYAMAASEAENGDTRKALEHLKMAIEANPKYRFIASHDPDFDLLAENAEFIKMLGGEGRKKT